MVVHPVAIVASIMPELIKPLVFMLLLILKESSQSPSYFKKYTGNPFKINTDLMLNLFNRNFKPEINILQLS